VRVPVVLDLVVRPARQLPGDQRPPAAGQREERAACQTSSIEGRSARPQGRQKDMAPPQAA